MTRRRGRSRKKLLDDLKDQKGYCQLKEEALDRNMWRNRFGRGFGAVVGRLLMMMMITDLNYFNNSRVYRTCCILPISLHKPIEYLVEIKIYEAHTPYGVIILPFLNLSSNVRLAFCINRTYQHQRIQDILPEPIGLLANIACLCPGAGLQRPRSLSLLTVTNCFPITVQPFHLSMS